MGLTYLGEQALSSIVPGLESAITQLQAESAQLTDMLNDKNSQINNINGQITGMQSAVTAAQNILTAANNLLSAANNALTNSNTLTSNLSSALAAAAIHEYVWNGEVANIGSDIANALGAGGLPGGSGATQQANAILIITADGNAWSAIKQVLRFQ